MESNAVTKHIAYGQHSYIMQVRDAFIAGKLKLPLDAASLRALSIPDSGIFSTKRSVEDIAWFSDGYPTELFERLAHAYQSNRSEYQDILKTQLPDLYAEVFDYIAREQIDLAHATATQLEAAFSDYEPKNQPKRMAYLFLALAREADIIPDVEKVPHLARRKAPSQNRKIKGFKTISVAGEVKAMSEVPLANKNGRAGLSSNQEFSLIKAQSDHLQLLLQQLSLDAEQLKQKPAKWVDTLKGNFNVLLQLLEEKEPEK